MYVQLSNLKLSPVEGDEEVELPTFTAEDLAAAVTNDMKFEITVQEEKLAQMKPNMAAIAEYRKKVRWLSLSLSPIRSLCPKLLFLSDFFFYSFCTMFQLGKSKCYKSFESKFSRGGGGGGARVFLSNPFLCLVLDPAVNHLHYIRTLILYLKRKTEQGFQTGLLP